MKNSDFDKCEFCKGKGYILKPIKYPVYVTDRFGNSYTNIATKVIKLPCPKCNKNNEENTDMN